MRAYVDQIVAEFASLYPGWLATNKNGKTHVKTAKAPMTDSFLGNEPLAETVKTKGGGAWKRKQTVK